MEERMNCVQISLTCDELWDVENKDDAKNSRVLHGSSNVLMIQDAIENMIEISKAKLYRSRSKLIIQDGK